MLAINRAASKYAATTQIDHQHAWGDVDDNFKPINFKRRNKKNPTIQ